MNSRKSDASWLPVVLCSKGSYHHQSARSRSARHTVGRRAGAGWGHGRVIPAHGCPSLVGDDETVAGPVIGDVTAVGAPVVERADQHQVRPIRWGRRLPSAGCDGHADRGFAPQPGPRSCGSRCSRARRSRRLTVRVARPAPMGRPSRSNHTSQVASQLSTGGRRRSAAAPDCRAAAARLDSRCTTTVVCWACGGGRLRCPSRPRPDSETHPRCSASGGAARRNCCRGRFHSAISASRCKASAVSTFAASGAAV